MIKFVCAGCGERLSVPDQHGGRKGVCPTCQNVNRIPLKGYSETQTPPSRGFAPVIGVPKAASPANKALAPVATPTAAETPNDIIRAADTTEPQAAKEVDVFESIRRYRVEAEKAAAGQPDETVPLQREKRLPRLLKIAILILAALVLVGALYSALLFAVHAFLKAMQQ